jgi:Protein of unknown function (DUF2000)
LFETKVAIVLLDDLEVWQKANAAAFLVSGIAGGAPELVGEEYVDGSGNHYLPMLRQPILIYAADGSGIRRAYERAMAQGVEQLAPRYRRSNSTLSGSACAPIGRPSTRYSTSCGRIRSHAARDQPDIRKRPLRRATRREDGVSWDTARRPCPGRTGLVNLPA